MRRLVKMRDVLVHPIDGDRVLNEVVGADAEKIDFARQRVAPKSPRSEFRSWRRLRMSSSNGIPSRATPFAALFEHGIAHRAIPPSPEIIGNMILTLPTALARRIARNCALKIPGSRDKNGSRDSRETDLFRRSASTALGEFVAAEIKRANDERMRRDVLRDLPVGFVLLLLSRQRRRD